MRFRVASLTATLLACLSIAVPRAGYTYTVDNPVVRGPIVGGIHGWPQFASVYPVASSGYVEEEFFLSGVAHQLSSSTGAPYTTRIVVRRPVDPSRFNGTAVVEWNNVTGAADLETLWPSSGEWAMRNGFAWVTVSAQLVGTVSGPYSLKAWDPVRYALIAHPGDSYAPDIFTQAIQAVKNPLLNRTSLDTPNRVDPMNGLVVEHVVAHGASQSASQLTSYITGGYHAAARLADAFSITRGGGNQAVANVAAATDTLVVQVQEEAQGARPADTDRYIVYEEAGIAHAPLAWYSYVWRAQGRDLAMYSPLPDAVTTGCSMNRGTSNYTHRMHLSHIQRWLTDGTIPPSGDRLARTGSTLQRDAEGLAVGGIRYPFVAVPVSYNSSAGCPLFGQYRPWSREKILSLYSNKDAYVQKVDEVVDGLLARGLILPEDAADAKREARAFDAWGGGSCFDTANRNANESGPVTSVLHAQSYGLTTLSASNTAHEISCEVAPTGL